jgi:hypothetical protein
MKKLYEFLFVIFLSALPAIGADFAPAANTDYLIAMFDRHGCPMDNEAPGAGVNIEHLLKTVDICNAKLTSYSTSPQATKVWANTAVIDWCAENLLMKPAPIRYITFTGEQYIDTGIPAGGKLKVEVDYQSADYPSSCPNVWGARTPGYNGVELQYIGDGVHFQIMSPSGNLLINLGRPDKKRHFVLYDYGAAYFDGKFMGKASNYNEVITPFTIYLGVLNENGKKNGITGFAGKVFSLKIWKDDTLVRDYIPAKNETGDYGMLDKVTGTFFGNDGQGDIIGPKPY